MNRFEDQFTEPQFRIRSKILLAFLVLSITSIVIFGYISIGDIKNLGNYALENSSALSESAISDSSKTLENMGELIIRQKAGDFAVQCEIFIKAHPEMTIRDLQASHEFQRIAVQSVGSTGYTLIYDRTGKMRFHPNRELVDFDLRKWKKVLPEFWQLFAPTFNGTEGSGFYDWRDSDGVIRRKFMYMLPIRGTELMAGATIYLGEFTSPIRETKDKITLANREVTAKLNDSLASTIATFLNIVIAMMLIVGVISLILARRITDPIWTVIEGVKAIGSGNLDYRVALKTGDELEELARSINWMGESLKALQSNMADRERLLRELEIARGTQRSFLPKQAPMIPGYDISAVNIPAKEVGGDFYDFIPVTNKQWGFVIADVSGKGMPAALLMAISRTLVRASTVGNISAAGPIRQANDLICNDTRPGMFVTLFYAILEQERNRLRFVNAGHNPPLLFRRGQEKPLELKSRGLAVGIKQNIDLREAFMDFQPGDTLVMYTDGVTDAINTQKEAFGKERLIATIRENVYLPSSVIIEKIRDSVIAFSESESQFDDITMVIIKVLGVNKSKTGAGDLS
jgi:serine phosphatase RsbU (regulator of sigma subunit)